MPEITEEQVAKVVILGDAKTGKSAFIIRAVDDQFFGDEYSQTIGVDFALKSIKIDEENLFRMHFWDVGGEYSLRHTTFGYIKGAVACVFVVDATRFETIEGMQQWYKTLKETNPHIKSTIFPTMIIVNKMDLIKDNDIAPLKQKVEAAAKKMQFNQGTPEIHYFSTKENYTFDITNNAKEEDNSKSAGELLEQLGESIYKSEFNKEIKEKYEEKSISVASFKEILNKYQSTSIFRIFGSRSAEINQLQKLVQAKEEDDNISKVEVIKAINSAKGWFNTSKPYRKTLFEQGAELACQNGYDMNKKFGADEVLVQLHGQFK